MYVTEVILTILTILTRWATDSESSLRISAIGRDLFIIGQNDHFRQVGWRKKKRLGIKHSDASEFSFGELKFNCQRRRLRSPSEVYDPKLIHHTPARQTALFSIFDLKFLFHKNFVISVEKVLPGSMWNSICEPKSSNSCRATNMLIAGCKIVVKLLWL
jgi:hypothetical protein